MAFIFLKLQGTVEFHIIVLLTQEYIAFWCENALRFSLSRPIFQNFPGGACPQTPLVWHVSHADTSLYIHL